MVKFTGWNLPEITVVLQLFQYYSNDMVIPGKFYPKKLYD